MKTQRSPPSIATTKATEEGGRTHLPSSASIASIVAEEKKRGVAKRMREVSRVHFVLSAQVNEQQRQPINDHNRRLTPPPQFYDTGHMDVSGEETSVCGGGLALR